MNLRKKRILAADTLGVGKERIIFNSERLSEIKEAITRQDIRDLYANNAISVKSVSGRKSKPKRKTRRRYGSIRKKVKHGKQDYVKLTRKLRFYIQELRKQENITEEEYQRLRKQIRASMFRSKAHIKENIQIHK
ncbi:MAG: 50S ribosomal protein L19e [Nanoarchaeota archaeon]